MTDENNDFREIAHCGGKVTFHIKTNADGARVFSVGYSINSMNPAVIKGLYALPQGIICGDLVLGGIGQAFNAPPFPNCIPVYLGSDSHGKFGHECPECKGYWRTSGTSPKWPMSCAYCGTRGQPWQFVTAAQRRYVSHYAHKLAEGYDSAEANIDVVIDMDVAGDLAAGEKPEFYYGGQTQQTIFKCEACGGSTDIKGQYGYCSSCGTRNNVQVLKAEFVRVRQQLNSGAMVPADALRTAVSAYDSCCRNLVSQVVARGTLSKARKNRLSEMLFHGLTSAADLRTILDINLLDGCDKADVAFIKMMLQRRHAFEHDGGQATERYLAESGDASVALGSLIRENRENVHKLIGNLGRMAENFDTGFHELFPAEEKPISMERDQQERMKRHRASRT